MRKNLLTIKLSFALFMCFLSSSNLLFAAGSVKAKFYVTDSCQWNELTTFDSSTTTGTGNKVVQWQWFYTGATQATSSAQNPNSIIFTASGKSGNHIKLKVTDSLGNVDSFERDITIIPNLKTDFSFTQHCSDTALDFNDNSGTVPSGQTATYSWDFGDGNTATGKNQTHKYSSPGIYTVKLTTSLSPNGCGGTAKKSIVAYDKPVVKSYYKATACQGELIDFEDSTSTQYSLLDSIVSWDFGDGSKVIGGSSNSPTSAHTFHAYTKAGTFTIIEKVKTENGCTDSRTTTITIYPKPSASYTVSNNCQNSVTSFSNGSTISSGTITGYKWDFKDAGATSTSTNPTHTYTTSGTFSVPLIATSDKGCIDTAINNVLIPKSPTVKMATSKGCEGQTTTFTDASITVPTNSIVTRVWDFGDGSAKGKDSTTTHTYAKSGKYKVTLSVTTSIGCSISGFDSVSVFAVPKTAFTNSGSCFKRDIQFTDKSTIAAGDNISSFAWDFGDANSTTNKSSLQNPTHKFQDTAGIYSVMLVTTSAKGGCTDTLRRDIKFVQGPRADFVNTKGCQNTNLQFTYTGTSAGSNMKYYWDFDIDTLGSTDTATQKDPVHSYNYGGRAVKVMLVANSSTGCPDTLYKSILPNPKPVADFIFDSACIFVCVCKF
ncbi:MAG: PKD domain-containing protein [Bacteroidetes bacterium]|nr:PKD domain-containing protein [Bacteroidota bacterium]